MNNSPDLNNHFPLKAGERPLFKSRSMLQQISRDIKRLNDPYYSQNISNIYGYIAAIDVVAELFDIRCEQGRRENSGDLMELLFSLPLFFNNDEVKEWEIERVWADPKFCQYTDVITEYGTQLDGQNPSDAYVTMDVNSNHIWEQWFKKSSKQKVLDVLDHSRKAWVNWESHRPSHENSILKNTHLVGTRLGMSKDECLSWTVYELMRSNMQFSKLWNLALTEFCVFNDLFMCWEKSFNLQKESISKLFYSDSSLVKTKIYSDMSGNDIKFKSIEELNKRIARYNPMQQVLSYSLNNNQELYNCFATVYQNNTLSLDSWKYIQLELDIIVKSLQNKNLSILIYGDKGTGKSSIAASILKQINKQGWVPKFEDSAYNSKTKEDKESIEYNLSMVASIIADKNNALVFDNNVQFLSDQNKKIFVKNFLEKKDFSQLWIVEDLSKIEKSILESFDMVLHISEMPFKERLLLAKEYFNDDDLSFRVSQSVKTPKEITNIAKWCNVSNDYSWKNAFYYLSSMNKLLSVAGSNELLLNTIDLDENIAEFAGNAEVNDLLDRLSDYFNHPHIYRELGAKVPKGILLMGSPGTGKTHFAKHLMKNVGVPMFMVETSKLVDNVFAINQVFNEARKKAPCILFMDEIDVLINNPMESNGLNLNKQKILNAFLAELDGFTSSDGILVIGATHRKIQPDPAAVRAGRLGETIYLTLPNNQSRKDIWKAHLKAKPVVSNINYDVLAHASSNFSGAEIAEAMNRAAIISARKRDVSISIESLLVACDDLFWGGVDSSMKMSDEDKYKVAIHEAGHALIAWKNGFNVNRITVRPRTSALGAVNWDLSEGTYTLSKKQLLGQIELALAGIASEEVNFGEYQNGGIGDLKQAKKILGTILVQSGFGENFKLSYSDTSDVDTWSEERKSALEKEEREILNTAMKNCNEWLTINKQLVNDFAKFLVEHKEVSGEILAVWKNQVLETIENEVKNNLILPFSHSSEEHNTIHLKEDYNNEKN